MLLNTITTGDTISFRYKEFEPDGADYFSGSWEDCQRQAPVIKRNGILGVEVIHYGTGLPPEFVPLDQCKGLRIVHPVPAAK